MPFLIHAIVRRCRLNLVKKRLITGVKRVPLPFEQLRRCQRQRIQLPLQSAPLVCNSLRDRSGYLLQLPECGNDIRQSHREMQPCLGGIVYAISNADQCAVGLRQGNSSIIDSRVEGGLTPGNLILRRAESIDSRIDPGAQTVNCCNEIREISAQREKLRESFDPVLRALVDSLECFVVGFER